MKVCVPEFVLIDMPAESGTPLDLNAKDDHLENAKDIDEFRFVGDELQVKCPFASHIRHVVDVSILCFLSLTC